MGQIGAAGSNIKIEALCYLIRSVVRDELQRIHCPPQPPAAGYISSLIRSEVQQVLQVALSSDVTSTRTEPDVHRTPRLTNNYGFITNAWNLSFKSTESTSLEVIAGSIVTKCFMRIPCACAAWRDASLA
ncbi:hypothetical protein HPB52_002953 [Rhipicephalus sanguineus]|uniref:Uncharacterized protein n=1 Tax=Rhipicephalus sanguineus TaxID=34632 RepID=A0A9D4PFL2_RHISA|nr:hypothetical protein HPB52_002953 [Rhipicephalus sanguineus]